MISVNHQLNNSGNTVEQRAANFRHLRAFREVARHKSIRQASTHVFLSQPAITQAIAKLEVTLGTSLFDRRSEGMFVTEPGRLFLSRVERALAYIETGAREAFRVGHKKGDRGFANLDKLVTGVQLRAAAALSEAENFSLAARNTGITQPSLHRAARDLERLSGMILFSASNQGIELSPAARIIARNAKLAFTELDQGRAEVEEWKGSGASHINIGTMPLARTLILPTAILATLKSIPDIRFSVIDGPYEDLLHGLRQGSIDILIGALRETLPVADVVQKPLFDDLLIVAARSAHPLAGKSGIKPGDLADFPWVVPRKGAPTRNHFEAMFEGQDLPTNLIEASSLVLIRGLILGSDALTMISAHQIREEQRTGLLVPIDIDTSGTARPIGLTMRQDWQPTSSQHRFLEELDLAGKMAAGQSIK
jgi:LysR family transcriptional regulator, regulator for genes of the gallate degradation pathway